MSRRLLLDAWQGVSPSLEAAHTGGLFVGRLLALANSLVRFSVRALWVALERKAAVRAFLSLVSVPGVAII
jgi:hypothetical protein